MGSNPAGRTTCPRTGPVGHIFRGGKNLRPVEETERGFGPAGKATWNQGVRKAMEPAPGRTGTMSDRLTSLFERFRDRHVLRALAKHFDEIAPEPASVGAYGEVLGGGRGPGFRPPS